MDITGLKSTTQTTAQEPMQNAKRALNTEADAIKLPPVDTVSISKEAMSLLNSDNGSYSPLSAGGTTLPTWPPKNQK